MVRISPGNDGFDAGTIAHVAEELGTTEPSTYHADEIRADLFPAGHTSRA
jgi:hypothetical protein